MCIPLRQFLVQQTFDIAEADGAARVAFLNLDSSLTYKDNGSRGLQVVYWHFDHTRSWPGCPIYTRANVYVMLRLTVGKSNESGTSLVPGEPGRSFVLMLALVFEMSYPLKTSACAGLEIA